jgi:adenylate cyclase
MANPDVSSNASNPLWRALLSGDDTRLRRGRRMFRLLSPTARERCRLCCAGFDGFSAPLMRAMGRKPWLRNPHFCAKCETVLAEQPGGAVVDIAMLYADVRGSTEMAARIGPSAFATMMQRFFRVATKAFIDADAIVDKMVGDEMIALFVPGLTGNDFRERAAFAGLELLRATGHGDPGGPWLSIGVGVHCGETFMGSIGVEGGNYQFSALGDPMNLAARLVGAAKAGEMVMSEAIWSRVAREVAAEPRSLELKGYAEPQKVYVARLPVGTSG